MPCGVCVIGLPHIFLTPRVAANKFIRQMADRPSAESTLCALPALPVFADKMLN